MKTSLIIVIALFLNTTLLLAEPLATLVQGWNPWILAAIETLLIFVYLVNRWLKGFSKELEMNFGPLRIFVVKNPGKKV